MNGLQEEFNALTENESLFFNLMGQDILDGLWYWNLENPKHGFLNTKLWQLLGFDPVPTQQQTFDWYSLINQENLQIIIDAYHSHLSDPKTYPFNVDIECKHKAGHTIALNLKGAIVYDEFTKTNRLLGIAICLDKYVESGKQLKQKKERFKNVIKGANLGIWEGNLNTGEVICNERWAEMIGYTLAELPPITIEVFYDFVHPDDKKAIQLCLDNHIEKRELYELEFRMRHKDGQWIWVLCKGEITKYDDKGYPKVVSGMHYDITHRKTSELLLTKYKDLLERSNEAANIGHWEVDLQRNSIFWSKMTRQIHGVTADFKPTLERGLEFIVDDESRAHIQTLFEEATLRPMEFKELIKIKPNNGDVKWVCLSGLSEFLNGQCIRLYGLLQDVDQIEKSQLKVILKEEQFRQTFNHSAVGMAFLSKENRLLQANASFCNILGYSEAELQQIDLAAISHSGDLELNRGCIEKLLQGKRQHLRMDYRFIHKKGSVIWTNTTLSVIYNEEGEVIHYISQVLDITERKQNEMVLQHNAALIGRINDAAQIGIWELDMATNTAQWSSLIKEMAGVPEDYSPALDDIFSYFKEGENREIMRNAMKLAMEEGEDFNHVLQVVNTAGRTFWSRIIGISDFKNGKCTKLYGFFQDVDKETQAAHELAVKEEELRLTFEHSPFGMAVIDLKGKLQKSNIRTTAILGYSEEELRKLSFFDITHPDDLEETENLMSQLMDRKRDFYTLEKRYIHKKGHIIWAHVSLSAVKNEKGEYLHFVSQIEDITERKKNELLLLNYKDRLEQSHIIGKLGSWEIDPETKMVEWSDNLKRILEADNYQPHSLDFSILNFVQEKDRKALTNAIQYAIDYGEKFDFEIEIITMVKNLKWMRMIGVPEFKNGRCVRLAGLIQDINESKIMQLNLGFSEEIFRRTFEDAAIGMMVINLEGELQKVNPRICEILGYSEMDLLKKSIFQLTHPEERETTFNLFEEIAVGKRENFRIEKRYIHADGKYVWVQIALAAVRNDSGEFTHLVSQIQDISDKKMLTDNLSEHNNRLINFAHIVSHNLRSHTSNISMLLDLAQQDYPRVVKNEYYKNVKQVSENMNETINHLNEIVEINSKVSSTLSFQNLLKNVKNAVKSTEPLAKQSGSAIEIHVDKDLKVLVVHAYLESVILNLLTNAMKYRSLDRAHKIIISAGIDGDFVFLSIKDNGLGIDLERYGSKIFGMYKTFHEHPDARGIGLFLCKNQVEAMGGKIEVESEVDKGANFTTYFRHENN
ncbi:Adaptive-response sensory-kinase SasA [Arenibacter antarcticus]|uniref:histidine kinase n=1 Tax=Arenibacter antarcticus TaxID=2040469 RepID=A0ABW5VA36_9FLAO|nr:PAS domain S-box protein [Arenibacter sp. H213]MCM4167680.1 hypothetical protein [Arenibacter sp. H213]